MVEVSSVSVVDTNCCNWSVMWTEPLASREKENYVVEPYPHTRMWINGRDVTFEKIVQEKEPPRTPFEESTFAFIRAWLSGEDTFHVTTSGSTGTPKNIEVSRQQMVTSAIRTASHVGLNRSMTALVCIDTRFIGGKMMLARSLTLGLRILAVDPCANPLIKVPIDKWVRFTAFVPYQVTTILESKHPHLLDSLQCILIGGAPIHNRDVERLQSFQCACYETYGMTETISHVALKLLNTSGKQQHFQALQGIDLTLDERGCLSITADYLPETIKTNDLVEITSPGHFTWQGRADNAINTGGIKVIPELLEARLEPLLRNRGITNRFIIAGMPDEKLGSRVVLILDGVHFSSEELLLSINELKQHCSPYEIPKEVYVASPFIFAGNEKTDRKKTVEAAEFLMSLR